METKNSMENIKIYENHLMDNIGFDDCNPITNGEYNILNKIIQPSNFVFDIGANCGDWSNQALERGANVVAFEPVPHEFDKLQQINNPKFKAYQFALNDKDETHELHVCVKPLEKGMSSLFRNWDDWKTISVATRSLDSFIEENKIEYINFAKIDTEGAEANILYGASKTLTNQNIGYIQFEYGGCYLDANKTLYEIYQYLTKFDYKIYRIVSDGIIHIDAWNDKLENYLYSNYIASTIKL